MKSLIFITVICTFFSFKTAISQCQCLPEGIEFNTQSQIDSFQINYPGCNEILGHVIIHGDDIKNVDGLNVVKKIFSFLNISDNDSLTDLAGFDSLKYCKSLYLLNNNSLNEISGFNSLDSISLFQLSNSNSLETINGFNSLSYAGDNIFITNCPLLTSISGFNSLPFVWGMYVNNNYSLTNISGFNSLTLVQELFFTKNYELSDISGFSQLESVSSLALSYIHLTDFLGLQNLKNITYYFVIRYNNYLETLSGLDSVDFNSAEVTIEHNHSLSMCSIENICNLLDTLPENFTVYDNATGCDSKEEIQENCITGNNEFHSVGEIKVFPNPVSALEGKKLTIEYLKKENNCRTEFWCFDMQGRLVYNELINNSQNQSIIDISHWKPGIYYAFLFSDSTIIARCKFVVQ